MVVIVATSFSLRFLHWCAYIILKGQLLDVPVCFVDPWLGVCQYVCEVFLKYQLTILLIESMYSIARNRNNKHVQRIVVDIRRLVALSLFFPLSPLDSRRMCQFNVSNKLQSKRHATRNGIPVSIYMDNNKHNQRAT